MKSKLGRPKLEDPAKMVVGRSVGLYRSQWESLERMAKTQGYKNIHEALRSELQDLIEVWEA